MHLGSRWLRLALSVGLTVAAAATLPARGQTQPPALPEAAPGSAPAQGGRPPESSPPIPAPAPAGPTPGGSARSPTQLFSGPSLYETGRVGAIPQAAPTAIEPQDELSARHEKSIQRAAAGVDTPPPRQLPGTLNPERLDREVEARFGGLENCRIDAARAKRVAPAVITANVLTLRWTIQPAGDVTETAVVATTPVDLEVMSCVKAAMGRWRFTGPRGGPVEVERRFSFRALH